MSREKFCQIPSRSDTSTSSRRDFLKTSALTSLTAGLAAATPAMFVNTARAAETGRSANEQLGIGAIGMRYQGSVITEKARLYGNIVGIADVDRHVREQARASFGSTPRIYENYLDLLQQKNVDVILIGAPDHWHTKMLIDACRAGKDVYCEKPLTLTIDEGKVIRNAVGETDQVVQVGTWQRSDHRFRLAVEMVRQGRIGKLQRVTCATDKNPTGGPFEQRPIPEHFNWDLWQGQTPDVPYLPERSHYTFRWWREYSGGKMTDWGAHHIDIAQWAIDSLPVEINGRAKYPDIPNGYNVSTDFQADLKYANGVELLIRDEGRRGILFEGDEGRIFVNRGSISGTPVDELASKPLNRDTFSIYDNDNLERPERVGKLDAIINHMGNFFDCIKSRQQTISDIEGQHRSVSTCHLANISMELGRPLKWDPDQEVFLDDNEANAKLSREQRAGFETV
ncbi:Inositol 2-dehydrogenase/D-chiro-inositol 3-dehydrogenase [Polystyrenella longa]|uniref:Inositol 2-dehydrogenase/D-chiro-inositol 3-dehydrogenase n=1 Tax=Polystyrenella longa TaxID=2528007 RepID=A0A518CP64_9PLAN|nr:Gfo/Idh/MocA family oxidoreductase [Polystyrenella longa]QDU81008.1 Inositol 2-dehydrogenase/D-chiro-inositol 3-dehydrogenase [Polystyrenella longa]